MAVERAASWRLDRWFRLHLCRREVSSLRKQRELRLVKPTALAHFLTHCSQLPSRKGALIVSSRRGARSWSEATCPGHPASKCTTASDRARVLGLPAATFLFLSRAPGRVARGKDSREAGNQMPGRRLGSHLGGEVRCPPCASVLFLILMILCDDLLTVH